MGLDTSHDCWHGPYSAFSRFRNQLARAAGYVVEPEQHGDFTHDTAKIDWEGIEQRNPGCYQGEWHAGEGDALVYLIAHSDCDGVIHPAQATVLADRIEELIPKLDSGDPFVLKQAELFVKGLRLAVERGEDVDFH